MFYLLNLVINMTMNVFYALLRFLFFMIQDFVISAKDIFSDMSGM